MQRALQAFGLFVNQQFALKHSEASSDSSLSSRPQTVCRFVLANLSNRFELLNLNIEVHVHLI